MRPRLYAATLALAAFVIACGGSGGGGGNTSTSPTAPTPLGSTCSGSPIANVWIAIGPRAGIPGVTPTSFQGTVQVYGENLPFTAPPTNGDQVFQIIRNVVPCDYELAVQVQSGRGPLDIAFGFPPGQKLSDSGGIDPASIVVIEGPPERQTSDPAHPACGQGYGAGSTLAPFTIRIRFRVVAGISQSARCK